ncbi:hypothetical protein [Herpetosiphon gulosus]|uniref:Uncharacterized protein n=1 Tax=Herpetosiphon gulosus TaxID=1973496 RepID=A0ABP9WVX2_9CHLR
MNPNNPQISNTINGSTINGGNVAIGNQGSITQNNVNHLNSNENIAVFGKLSIYIKNNKPYQDLDLYISFSCIASIFEDKTGFTSSYTLFTGFLYLNAHGFPYCELNYSYHFPQEDRNLLRKIFNYLIENLENSGFYFNEEKQSKLLDTIITPLSFDFIQEFIKPQKIHIGIYIKIIYPSINQVH